MLSDSLDRAVSERLRQERAEGLPVSISFEECSTWADDFRGAVLRHYTGSKGAPVGKKQGWRIFEHVGKITNLIGWKTHLGEQPLNKAEAHRLAHKLRDPKFYTARTKRAVNSGGAL